MSLVLFAFVMALGVLLGTLACMEAGRRLGIAGVARDPEGVKQGFDSIDGAVFGLFGLLLAFTFSGAASRFDERRRLMAGEANVIGTAYLRVDLLPIESQPEIRDLFRRYVDLRIETFQHVEDPAVVSANLDRTAVLQQEIWSRALTACRKLDEKVIVVPALNEMIDMTTTQLVAAQTHPPKIVYVLLVALSFIAALLAGYDMARTKCRNWLHMLIFAGTMSLVVYVIVDIEYPRLGLIRVDADQVLVDLRKSMK